VPPFVLEDFSTYPSIANLLADPRGIYATDEDINPTQIVLDPAAGFAGSPNSMRYDYPDQTGVGHPTSTSGNCTSYTISRSLNVPGGSQELWIEVVAKTSGGFLTMAPANWGCTSDEGLKFVDVGVYPGDRFSIGLRTGSTPPASGQMWFGYPDNVTDPQGKVNYSSVPFSAVDGNWHVYRQHVKISSGYPGAPNADGIMEGWIDGVKVVSEIGIRTNSTAGNTPPRFLTGVSLARNLNQGPAQNQSLWWGRVAIYATNPGW
jgi:hypothetical protein